MINGILITDEERLLVDHAVDLLRARYALGRHHVSAAVVGSSGKVYLGLHLDSPAIDVCAESVAIGAAATQGDVMLTLVVAVSLRANGQPQVLTPCGTCRELLAYLYPDINVIVEIDDKLLKVPISKLLPLPYREKYQKL